MIRRRRILVFVLAGLMVMKAIDSSSQSQVVPCQLNNPDQDTLRLYPDRTNYRTEFIRTDEVGDKRKVGGEALYKELEKRLGDKWDPIWETKDIPYVFYEILKGPDRIGWVFGANQGWPGADNSQLMFAIDLNERVQEFYYQKLPSLEKELLQIKEFYAQFIGLTLESFYIHEALRNLKVQDNDILGLDMIARIKDPTKREHEGFQKTLRGTKKVLVYIDDFKFGNKIKKDEVFENVKYLTENKDKVPRLSSDALAAIKKSFPEAQRFVVDLHRADPNPAAPGSRSIYPVYVVYKEDAYKAPFVRGAVAGYELPLYIDTPAGKVTATLAIGAQGKEKGKIVSAEIDGTEVNEFRGLSLVHFYTKDVLTKTGTIDEKIDKIAPIKVAAKGKDITSEAIAAVKNALIIVDENYLNNFFNKDEITKKIEEYLARSSS